MPERPHPDMDRVRDALREADDRTEPTPPEDPREDEDSGEGDDGDA